MVTAKAALQILWKDTLTVTEYKEVTNPVNFSTGFEEAVVLENQPCKLSFTTLSSTNQNDTDAKLVQVTKIFLDNAAQIKPGSKITVQRGGQTFEFSQSGLPGLFTTHQEIVLVPFVGWA
jgi:hypothetical protein